MIFEILMFGEIVERFGAKLWNYAKLSSRIETYTVGGPNRQGLPLCYCQYSRRIWADSIIRKTFNSAGKLAAHCMN